MSRNLHCEIGDHDWEHPGGRGRPPKNCPKHQPVKDQKKPESPKPKKEKRQLPNPNDVPVNRRPEPERHKEQREVASNPFILRAQAQKKAERVQRLQEGKTQAKIERTQAEADAIEKEYSEIDARIKRAETEYDASLADTKKAHTKEEIEKAFNKSDAKQSALLNLSARKRKLEAIVEQMTDPAYVMAKATGEIATPERELDFGDISEDQSPEEIAEQVEAVYQAAEQDESGYNDILSNPEQFDNPYQDIADLLENLGDDI